MPQPAPSPVPEGMNTITASLWFNGNCKQALEFYQKAFGAELMGEAVPTPDGNGILHAMMTLGNSHIMMADAWPGFWEQGPKDYATTGLWLYVEDSDALYSKAVKAGCDVLEEIMDAFWGDRMGKVKDPFGHTWAIATHKWVYTPEEMQKGQEEWLASLTPAES